MNKPVKLSQRLDIALAKGAGHEYSSFLTFYRECDYIGRPSPQDDFIVARLQGQIVGILRLCHENGVLVLRGMEVARHLAGRGIGSALLGVTAEAIGARECYGICFAHLERFYGRIGFRFLPEGDAPPHLVSRLKEYSALQDGKDRRLMKRDGPIYFGSKSREK